MELIKNEGIERIYRDEYGQYTMFNMSDYIKGASSDEWILKRYEILRKDGKKLQVEALIDQYGSYMQICIISGRTSRIISLDCGMVYRDVISLGASFGYECALLDGNISSPYRIKLNDYLATKQSLCFNGKVYDGELLNNDLIVEFLNKNEELSESMNQGRKRN